MGEERETAHFASPLIPFAPQGGVSEASASRSSHPFRLLSDGRNVRERSERE